MVVGLERGSPCAHLATFAHSRRPSLAISSRRIGSPTMPTCAPVARSSCSPTRATPLRRSPRWFASVRTPSSTGSSVSRPRASLDWRTDRAAVGPPKADELYDQLLDATVDKDPRSLGQRFSNWTRRNLVSYLALKLKVEVSVCTLGRHLHKLGWSLVRPALTVKSPDPNYTVKAATLEVLKARAQRGEIVLLFEDEFDLNLLPGVTRCWTRMGEQRRVLTPGVNQKRYGFGALDYTGGALVTHFAEHKDSVGFCQLLEAVVSHYCPGEFYGGPKVVLVMDNYGIHKSKLSLASLAKYADRLEVFHLPSYSPKLNLIEWVWRQLRARVTHNHLFESIDALLEAVRQFFSDLSAHPATVLSLIGNCPNQQTIPIPNNLCSPI